MRGSGASSSHGRGYGARAGVVAPGARNGAVAPRRVRKEAVAFGDALTRYLKAAGLSLRMQHLEVYRAWNESVGAALARRARPVSFKNGALCVEVESAAHLQELQNFTGDQYRTLANARLGEALIRKIAFRMKQ